MQCRPLLTMLAGTLLLCALPATGIADEGPSNPVPQELVVLNWSQYLDEGIVKQFESQFNARVRQVYFESDDLREHMIIEMSGAGYDVVMVNGVNIEIYQQRGWLAPLTDDEIPNLKLVDDRWFDAHPGARGYTVPYFWGTLGIAYRKDLITEPMTSWRQLFEPVESLRGRIGMIDSSRDAIGMALKALGYSVNSGEPEALLRAEKLLMAQRPFVSTYAFLDLTADSAMVSGEVIAAMLYSGDALMLQQFHPEIEYVVPLEGGNLWVDYWAVLASSDKKKLANAFLNFLNEPDIARAQAEYVHYATPNLAAEKLLPAAFRANPLIYPSAQALANSESYTQLSPRVERQRNTIIMRVLD